MAEKQMPSYNGNSKLTAAKQEEKREIHSSVNREDVTLKKRSVGRKFADNFIKEDAANVKNYIFFDVIIPTVKDMISGAVNMVLYGDTRGGRDSRSGRRGFNERTSYEKYYDGRGNAERPSRMRRTSDRYDMDDVIFNTRAAAQDFLDDMVDVLDRYGNVTVEDFYSILQTPEKAQWTDRNWGWEDLSTARVIPSGSRFIIDLPRVQSLK